jgi:hypothetical protein
MYVVYSWLVVLTTDDVSLATNSISLPIIGTKMPTDTWFDMTTPYNVGRKDICE